MESVIAQTLHERHRRRHPRDPLLVLGPCLGALRRGVGCRIEFRKGQRIEKLAPGEKDPDVGAVKLVRAAGEEIAADGLDVDRLMRREVDRIDEEHRARARPGHAGACGLEQRRARNDLVAHAQRHVAPAGAAALHVGAVDEIADAHDRANPVIGEPLEMVVIDRARLSNHPRAAHDDSAFDLQRAPWSDVGMMIEIGDDHFIAGFPCPAQGASEVEGE